jgi:hypothetical protein
MTTVCDDIKAARSELQRLGTNRHDGTCDYDRIGFDGPRAPPRRKSPRAHRISLTRFIFRIPCSLAMTRADSEMLTPARSTSVWLTQGRRLEAIPELASNPLRGASSALSGHTTISTASPPRGINTFHNGLGLPVFAARNSSQYQDEPSSWRARGIATASGPE